MVSAKEDPQGFVDFIEDLVIDYKKISHVSRRETIRLDIKKNLNKNKNKENGSKC